jgi:4a-hydroxytetrahydrobiopterin dehydratase
MKIQTAAQLASQKCQPCAGGAEPYWPQEVERQLMKLKGWTLNMDGKRIRKEWWCKDFATALKFINDIAKLAEREDHHPDLHLLSYRKVMVETYTHVLGGLSDNDFILAAKVDEIPVQLKPRK